MINTHAPQIFVSYRRSDSQYMTDRLVERLGSAFGTENVFQDVGHVPYGEDFRTFIADQIRICDIVLIMMGERWTEEIKSRAETVDDFVRLEVEQALQQRKFIIPVLIDRASMPSPGQLPASISEMVFRNAAPLRANPDFDTDARRLIEQIQEWAVRNGLRLPSKTPVREAAPIAAQPVNVPAPSRSSPEVYKPPRSFLSRLLFARTFMGWIMRNLIIMLAVGMLGGFFTFVRSYPSTGMLTEFLYALSRENYLREVVLSYGCIFGGIPYNSLVLLRLIFFR